MFIRIAKTAFIIYSERTMGRIKGIIIDKDGTLFNYAEVWGPVVSRSIENGLKSLNLPESRLDKVTLKFEIIFGIDRYKRNHKHGILFRNDLLFFNVAKLVFISLANGLNPFKVEKTIMEHIRHISDNIEEDIRNQEFPGIPDFIDSLKNEGMKVGMVTSDHMHSTTAFLRQMGIEGKLDFIATGDSGMPKKPNPGAIFEFMKKYGLKNDEVAVVGDSKIDMRFAKNAKVGYTVAVLTGSGDKKLLERMADKVYPAILDLYSDPVIFEKKS